MKIICVGKIKEKFFRDAIEEYVKRISKYTKLEIVEIPDESDFNLKKERPIVILTISLFSLFINTNFSHIVYIRVINIFPNINFLI